jgi:hypothetical protein
VHRLAVLTDEEREDIAFLLYADAPRRCGHGSVGRSVFGPAWGSEVKSCADLASLGSALREVD